MKILILVNSTLFFILTIIAIAIAKDDRISTRDNNQSFHLKNSSSSETAWFVKNQHITQEARQKIKAQR